MRDTGDTSVSTQATAATIRRGSAGTGWRIGAQCALDKFRSSVVPSRSDASWRIVRLGMTDVAQGVDHRAAAIGRAVLVAARRCPSSAQARLRYHPCNFVQEAIVAE